MMIEKIKLLLTALLVAAGVAGFYFLADQATIFRVLAVLAGLAAAVFVFSTSTLGRSSIIFARESAAETKKVVWPSRKETIQTTTVVFVLVVTMALFLWVIDVGFLYMVKSLMGRGA